MMNPLTCPIWIVSLGVIWSLGSATSLAVDRVIFTQIPMRTVDAPTATPPSVGVGRDVPLGSRIVALDVADPARHVTVLTTGFVAAGRPDLSFDGKRILFVGKRRADEPFYMWEMDVDGGDARQITDTPGNVSKAIYLSTIYTLDADEPVYQIAFRSDADRAVGGSLYTCRMDGTRIRRITFDPMGVSDPYLLSDSRLLLARWSSADLSKASGTAARTTLMTVNTDGTDLFPFAAIDEPPAVRSMPCETLDGRIVYIESAVGGTDRGGSLVAVSRSRSLHTRRVIANDPHGRYHSPSALPDGNLLVSYRSVDAGSYGIYMLDPSSGIRTLKLFDDPQWHDVDAIGLQPRPVPHGRSSVVDEGVDYGLLYCLNAYLSDREEGNAIRPGQIKRLRVLKAVPDNEMGASGSPGCEQPRVGGGIVEELLGEVPVEPDGSFFLKVPARTPLRVETLDADGRVLQRMASWVWVMPKEARGCVGCHEDRELAPFNRHVLALRKKPKSVGVADRARSSQGDGPSNVQGEGR